MDGQCEVSTFTDDADLIILDNVSTLTRSGRENESESWASVQSWLLNLRREGKAVLLIHHAGKSGQQRGTSKREDILDTIVELRRPQNYIASDGARCEVYFQKVRQFCGPDAEPFEARCEVKGNSAIWIRSAMTDSRRDEAQSLHQNGLGVRQIAEKIGVSKSTVARLTSDQQTQLL